MRAILKINWRKSSLIRLFAVLLAISPLFTWTFLLKNINEDGKKTVTDGQKSQISGDMVGDSWFSVTEDFAKHESKFMRSENDVNNFLWNSPNREHKSAIVYKKKSGPVSRKRRKRSSVLVVQGHVTTTMTTVANLDPKRPIVTAFQNVKTPTTYKTHTLHIRGKFNDFERVKKPLRNSLNALKDGNMEKLERVYNSAVAELDDVTSSERNLIIAAQPRTGSSFLGDALNQHPNVFYLFEPLYVANSPKHSNDASSLKFLEGVLHCKFNSPQYVREIHKFRRFSSKALSSPPLCKTNTHEQSPQSQKSRCTVLTSSNMESTCKLRNYSRTIMKILTPRIPSLKIDSLFPLCNSKYCSILYLVRDPRAIIYSHMKVGFMTLEKIRNITAYKDSRRPLIRLYSTQVCQQIEANVRIFQTLPGHMKRKHKMIRYEDLARDPIQILTRIYKMAGLNMTESTLQWITSHTGEEKTSERDKKNEFSTKRNSKAVIDTWRLEMDPCFVDIVEESCRSVMKLLGYRMVNRSEKLQYDLNVSLSGV